MHKILLPRRTRSRIRNSYRYPYQAAVAARLPLIGRRVPLRGYWQRQPLAVSRAAEAALGRLIGLGGGTAAWCSRAALRTAPAAEMASRARAQARDAASVVASRTRAQARDAATEAAHRARETAYEAAHTAREAARDATHAASRARTAAAQAARQRPSGFSIRMDRRSLPLIIAGAAVGAGAMYWLDASEGRRRRAMVRDRFAHLRAAFGRDLPHRLERRGRYVRGISRGFAHDAAGLLHRGGHHAFDDETLVARVRSEALRDRHLKSGEVNIDAYEGCVTLRGQIPDVELLEELVQRTQRIEGVRSVRSYLHLPGTVPPNKAEVLATGAGGEMPGVGWRGTGDAVP